ncbi:glucose 1-dehydrogenase, partial [mine drainage metagenome]
MQRLIDSALDRYKRIDVLVNNAGVLLPERDLPVHELSSEVWDYVMGVNLRSCFLCAKYAVPSMLKQGGGGSIIQMGSPTGIIACAPRLTAYSASKAGIMGLTRVMAAAYARNHIRVNSIVPGTMETPMNDYFLTDDSKRAECCEAIPLGRLGKPKTSRGSRYFLRRTSP